MGSRIVMSVKVWEEEEKEEKDHSSQTSFEL